MNEVTKLYENAGVEPEKKCYYWDCPYSTGMPANDISYAERNCQDCNNPDKAVYPPFTAEKQLKLIEFMLKKYGEETIGFELWKDNSYHVMCHLGYDGFENYADSNTLCGAIAGLITLYWQSLTEEERRQIKNILESEVRE